MNCFRRNAKNISIANMPIAVTLIVTGILYSIILLAIIGGVVCVLGAIAFATHATQPRMKCKVCRTEDEMALEYESGGICRKCLLDIVHLPGVLEK